jgi:hypothetical protein
LSWTTSKDQKRYINIIEDFGHLNLVLVGSLEQLGPNIFPFSSKQTNRIVGTNRQVGQCYQLFNLDHSILLACSFATQSRIQN